MQSNGIKRGIQRTLEQCAAVSLLVGAAVAPTIAAAQAPPPASSLPAVPPAPPVAAGAPSAPAVAQPAVTTNDVTLNLIHLLVQNKIITAKQADALFEQAKQQAGASAAPSPAAAPAPPAAAGTVTAKPAATPAPTPSVHVTYVPEIVREQIKEEAKKELIASGDLAPPKSTLPDWLERIKIGGDFRFRYERQLYDGSNSPLFINFSALGSSATPFDISSNNTAYPPLVNTTEDRTRFRVRARLGVTDEVTDDVTAGIRISTGTDVNPVSPNETLGADLNKYTITFDRAYLDYHPLPWASLRIGRFADPWFATDLQWYSDLNFDGAVLELAGEVTPRIRPFLTVGAFPVQNTALDFPTNAPLKQPSRDKWLYAAQVGVSWLPEKQYLVKLGAAYFDYQNIEGQTSSPCLAVLVTVSCNTDNSRPQFALLGNTFYGIRNIVVPPTATQPSEYQIFGLASPFRILDITARLDMARFDPVHLILDGEAALNLAFSRSVVASKDPVNNLGSGNNFVGGDLAYMARLTVGYPEIRRRGDWNMSFAYKYLESDSVVDAFTDPDFREGGTNSKGYIIGLNLGLANNTWLTARYLSATEVSGPPLAVDVIQVDLNAKF